MGNEKSFAIQILVTGMNVWGLSILDASKLAAEVLQLKMYVCGQIIILYPLAANLDLKTRL